MGSKVQMWINCCHFVTRTVHKNRTKGVIKELTQNQHIFVLMCLHVFIFMFVQIWAKATCLLKFSSIKICDLLIVTDLYDLIKDSYLRKEMINGNFKMCVLPYDIYCHIVKLPTLWALLAEGSHITLTCLNLFTSGRISVREQLWVVKWRFLFWCTNQHHWSTFDFIKQKLTTRHHSGLGTI